MTNIMLTKIVLGCLFVTSLFSAEHVYLKTPVISQEKMIGTNVGIRPFRKTGVRIEGEWIGDKFIIHNYGYGSSGLTLAFGGVLEVLNILDKSNISSKKVAVLGAGVVGLTTSYDLLKQGYDVHIYANAWSPHLTSNVAAGIWSPLLFPKDLPDDKKQLHLRMQKNAEARFLNSVKDSPEFAGIGIRPSYSFSKNASQESDRTKHREEIIAHFDNGVIKRGRRMDELWIDGQLFMDDLFLQVKRNGAVLKQRHFESLQDILSLEEPILINSTSMGSIELFNDQEFLPVRGQLVYFQPQKDLDYLYFHSIDNLPNDSNLFFVSIYPCSDRIILGGVYEYHQMEPIVTQEVIDKLIENAEKCLSGRP